MPRKAGGKTLHSSWAWRKVLGGQIQSTKVGGGRFTCDRWVRAYLASLNPGTAPETSDPDRDLAHAERELAAAGL